MAILTIARLTIVEASRRRLLIALAGLTLVVIAFTGWGFSKIPDLSAGHGSISPVEAKLIASQVLILVAFLYSGLLALTAALIAAPAIHNEMESGILLTVLARPVHRSEVVIGKAVGFALVLVVYAAASVLVEFAVVDWAASYVPPHPVGVILFLSAQAIALMLLALALSTRLPAMAGGVLALGSFFLSWLGGVVGSFGLAFQNRTIENVATAVSLILPSDGLWRGAIWSLEPAAVIATTVASGRAAASNPFFAGQAPSAAYLAWCALWMLLVLVLALLSFRAREV